MMNIAVAQPLSRMKDRLIQDKGKTAANFQLVAKMPGQGSLLLGDDINVALSSAPQWLSDKLQLSKGVDEITFVGQPTLYKDIKIQKWQYFYRY